MNAEAGVPVNEDRATIATGSRPDGGPASAPAVPRPRSYSLQSLLILLVLVTALPLIGMLVYTALHAADAEIERAKQTVVGLADVTDTDTGAKLDELRRLAMFLAARTQNRTLDPKDCDPLMGELLPVHKELINLATVDLSGQVVCSRLGPAGGPFANVGTARWMQDLRRSNDFVIGQPQLGIYSGRWVLIMAYPLRNAAGAAKGAVEVVIDMATFQPLARSTLPGGGMVAVIDRQGNIIARVPNPELHVGKNRQGAGVTRMVLEGGNGTSVEVSSDGVERLYGYKPIGATGWYAVAGMATASVYAQARRDAWRASGLGAFVLILAALVGMAIQRRIALPMDALSATARRVAAGEYDRRAPLGEGPREVAEVAAGFNRMLDQIPLMENALRESEIRYRALVENSPEAMLVHRDGRVLMVNAAALRLYGAVSRGELVGTIAADRVHPEDRDAARARSRQLPAQGTPSAIVEVRHQRVDGSLIEVEVQSVRMDFEGLPAVLVLIRDISVRKAAERRVARLSNFYTALSKTNAAMVRETDRASLCNAVCEIAVTHGHLVSASIRLYDPADRMLKPYGRFGPLAGWIGERVFDIDDPRSRAARAARERRRYICNDLFAAADLEAARGDASSVGVHAAAGFPLTIDGEIGGVFSLYAPDKDFFDDELADLLDEMAANLSFAFSRLKSAAALTDSEARYRMLFDATPDMIMVNCEGRVAMLNNAGARLFGLDTPARHLGTRVLDHIEPGYRELVHARLTAVVEQRRPAPLAEIALRRDDGARVDVEIFSLPIEFEGKPATLSIAREIGERKLAVRRVRRLSNLYAALSHTNEAIFRESDRLELCRQVCEIAVVHGGLVAAAIRRYEPATGTLEAYCDHGAGDTALGRFPVSVDTSDSNAARVAREGRHCVANDLATAISPAQARDALDQLGIRASAGFPLHVDGELAGVLSVFAGETEFFDNEMIRLLDEMANNLSFAFSKQKSVAALAASEERYRALFDATPDSIVVICEGRMVLLNPAAVRMFGVGSAGDMLGRLALDSIAPSHHQLAMERMRTVLRERQPVPSSEQVMLRADGTPFEVELVSLPFDYAGKPAILSIGHELTERKAAQRRVGRLTRLYAALSRTNEAIFRVSDPLELCRQICEIAVTDGGLATASIRRLDLVTRALEPYSFHGRDLGWIGRSSIPLTDPTKIAARVTRDGSHHVINDIAATLELGDRRTDHLQAGLRSAGWFGLQMDGEPAGMFSVFTDEPGYFDAEFTGLFLEMARNLSFAFSRQKSAAALATSEARYRALFDASPDAIRVVSEDRVVMFNPAGARLLGVDSPARVIGQPVADTVEPSYREEALRRIHAVIEQRRPLPPAEQVLVRADGRRVEAEVVSLPFEYEGKPAALSILHDLTGRKAAERRVNRLTSLYAALSRTNEAMFRETDPLALCRTVCEIAVTHGGLASAAIRSYNADTRMLEPYCHHGPCSGLIGLTPISLDDPISNAARAARDGGHYVSNDQLTDPLAARALQDAIRAGVRSAAGFSLHVDGSLAGVLSVFAAEAGFFDPELTGLLAEMANNLSFALAKQKSAVALATSEERYRALFDASPDAIRVICEDRVVILNPAGVRLFGLDSAEGMVGQLVYDHIDPAYRELAKERIRTVIEERRPAPPSEQALVRGDGKRIDVEVVTLPFDYGGKPAALSIVHDLTARKAVERTTLRLNAELETRVQRRTAELKRANEDLEAFSYTVAHDLRAPLRRMNGFAALLRESLEQRLAGEERTFLERISEGGTTMDRLIEGLLALAHLGRAELAPERVDLSELAGAVAADLRARDPQREVEFVIAADQFAQADMRLIKGVLENLLGNAWKFTSAHARARIEFGALPPGSLPEAERGDGGSDRLRVFYVRDDGAGFDPRYAGKLFGTFQRLHTKSQFDGTGIGLASVKRIIVNHGGSVWAEGAIEQGATIYFTLPVVTDPLLA